MALPGEAGAVTDCDDRAFALVSNHGIELLKRVCGGDQDGDPHEVDLLAIPRKAALDAYFDDPGVAGWLMSSIGAGRALWFLLLLATRAVTASHSV